MRISEKLLKYILFEFIICIFMFSSVYLIKGENNQYLLESVIGFFTILNLVGFFFEIKYVGRGLFSVASLFVVLMYLFNLGLPISRLFGWIDDDIGLYFMNRRIYSMGKDLFFEYLVYGFLLITMLQFGIVHYYCKKRHDLVLKSPEVFEQNLSDCKRVGVIMMIIGLLPYIYEESFTIRNTMIYGYQNAENTETLSGTGIGLMGNLFVLGFIAYLFSIQKNKKLFNVLLLLFSAYQVARMFLTGDRSTSMVNILVLILMRHKLVSPIKGLSAIKYVILAYAGMIIIKAVELTRSISSTRGIDEVTRELLQKNMLAETVFEYGGNVWCGMMVYYSVPSTAFFRLGTTYLAAMIGKPLSILKITDYFQKYADFSVFLQDDARGSVIASVKSSMGGSFSGEWWYNFGWVGILLIPVFGYFLAMFSDACFDKRKNPAFCSYLLFIATNVLWWVRQYFTSVTWAALFYGIVTWLLFQLVSRKKADTVGRKLIK